MNDKFKFRLYAPIQEVYTDVEKIDYSKGLVSTIDGETFKIDDVELLQCTGLRDKNGKLIYSGDILKTMIKIRNSVEEICETGKKYTIYEPNAYVSNNGDLISKYLCGTSNWKITELDSCKIVGNIYTNDLSYYDLPFIKEANNE